MKFSLFLAAFLALAAPASAQVEEDRLDTTLFQLVAGGIVDKESFYDDLMYASLYVFVEPSNENPSQFVFSYRLQNDRKIIDIYTSEAQAAKAPPVPNAKLIEKMGRELFESISKTGCDIGLNSYSGHGGQFTSKKILELLAK